MASRYFDTMSLKAFSFCPMPFLFVLRSSIRSRNLSSVELLMHFNAVRVIHSQRLNREKAKPTNIEFIAKLKDSNGADVVQSFMKSQTYISCSVCITSGPDQPFLLKASYAAAASRRW